MVPVVNNLGDRCTVVIAKAPLSGRSKTRLCPPFSFDQASAIAEAALIDTLAVVSNIGGRSIVALDGEVGTWLPAGFEVVGQGSGELGQRLAHVITEVGGPVVIVAMDTPQLTAEMIERAHQMLDGHDTVLGPTEDGGYWLVGTTGPWPGMFDGVPMSTDHTLGSQRQRLAELGRSVALIETLRDVDTAADAVAVARLVPGSGFARAVAAAMVGASRVAAARP